MSMKPTFETVENDLCAELKLDQEQIFYGRSRFLVPGVHWDYVKKRVLLAAAGVELLRALADHIRAAKPEKNADTGTLDAGRGLPEAVVPEKTAPRIEFKGKLLVWGVPGLNQRLIVAYVPGSEPENPLTLVSVFVRDNRNFLRGMELPGPGRGLHRTAEMTFNLVGPCPRWRGRW